MFQVLLRMTRRRGRPANKRTKRAPPAVFEAASDFLIKDFNKNMMEEVYNQQFEHASKEPAQLVKSVELPPASAARTPIDEMGLADICSAFVDMAFAGERGTDDEMNALSSRLERVCMEEIMKPQLPPNDEKYIRKLYEEEGWISKEDRQKWERHIQKTQQPCEWGIGPLPFLMECAYRNEFEGLIEATEHCDYYESLMQGEHEKDCDCTRNEVLRLRSGVHNVLTVAIDMEHFELISELYKASEDDAHLKFVLERWNCQYDQLGRVPASTALLYGHTDIARLLLEKSKFALLNSRIRLDDMINYKINVNFPPFKYELISIWADVCGHNGDELLKLLIEHHELTEQHDDSSHVKLAVRDAAVSGNIEALECLGNVGLIRSWNDVFCDTSSLVPHEPPAHPFMSPLHYAVMKGDTEMVKYILAKCPSTIHIRDCLHLLPLEKALLWNEGNCFYDMRAVGAELPPLNRMLDLALQYRITPLCDLLLDEMSSPSYNLPRLQPLSMAVGCRMWKVAERLVSLYLSSGGISNKEQSRDLNRALNTALKVFGLDDSPNGKLAAVVMLTSAGAFLEEYRRVEEKGRHGPIVEEILFLKPLPVSKAHFASMRVLFKFLEDQPVQKR